MAEPSYVYFAILTAAAVSYAIRVLPLTLIRRPIRSRFIRSFLYYVPYVTLAVMTFPAIVQATDSTLAGAAALIVGIVVAWKTGSLIGVAAACCAVVFVLELFL
jgi:branched-subunit amino acid transport protein